MTGFIHLHYSMPMNTSISANKYILNLGMGKSRIESSSERDQNLLEVWKKDKRYHVCEKPFDENMAESRKVWELKKRWSLFIWFICSSYIDYWDRLDQCIIFSWIVTQYIGCNPRFCPEWPHSKFEDGSQKEVSQKFPDYTAFSHVEMQVHL